MRVACLSIPDFWVNWARTHDEIPDDRPLILVTAGRVRDCSREARGAGVQPGVSERVLPTLCPDALVREVQTDEPRAAWRKLLAALEQISPAIEEAYEGLAFLSIIGLERHYPDELHLGLAVAQIARGYLALPGSVGIADGKFIAYAAARQAEADWVLVVPAGAERYFLQDLAVDLLGLAEADQRQLDLLGLQTLSQYAELPRDAVSARFGKAGSESWHWAQGIDNRPLIQHQQERSLVSALSFDDPLREQSLLERAVERMVGPLGDALWREGLACQELHLLIEAERGPVREERCILREPTASPDRLQAVVVERLTRLSCAPETLELKLTRLVPLEANQQQLDLFVDRQLAAEFNMVLQTLTARYGENCFQRAHSVNPDALLPEQRCVLEQFRMAT